MALAGVEVWESKFPPAVRIARLETSERAWQLPVPRECLQICRVSAKPWQPGGGGGTLSLEGTEPPFPYIHGLGHGDNGGCDCVVGIVETGFARIKAELPSLLAFWILWRGRGNVQGGALLGEPGWVRPPEQRRGWAQGYI